MKKLIVLSIIIIAFIGCKENFEGYFESDLYDDVPLTYGVGSSITMETRHIECKYLIEIKRDSLVVYTRAKKLYVVNQPNLSDDIWDDWLKRIKIISYPCTIMKISDKGFEDDFQLRTDKLQNRLSVGEIFGIYYAKDDKWIFEKGLLANVESDLKDRIRFDGHNDYIWAKSKRRDVIFFRVPDSLLNVRKKDFIK